VIAWALVAALAILAFLMLSGLFSEFGRGRHR
jgi:hypothetical protein